MKISWTKGLSKQEAAELKADYIAAATLRRRLKRLLEDDIDLSQKTSRSKLLYDNPNWALLQADQRGYERALSEIISLIE
ncbi:Phage protein [Pseudomonas phage GP100]|nr:Phage protein [Pseudomonas phage GP100]